VEYQEENSHFREAGVLSIMLLFLVPVAVFEIQAAFFKGNLAVNGQLADVTSDLVVVALALATALMSGFLDFFLRDHKEIHREEKLTAIVNIIILVGGLFLILFRVVHSIKNPEDPNKSLIVVTGPLIGILSYRVAGYLAKGLKSQNPITVSIKAHLKGDVWVSALTAVFASLTLVFDYTWLNPLGGLAGFLILLWVFVELMRELAKEQNHV
jgi:Co/Zn/Cd efflux system component